MNTFTMNVNVRSTSNGPVIEVSHSPHKKESIDASVFQAVGLLYRLSDALVEQQPQLVQVVTAYFTSRLRLFGLREETVQILANADTWSLRMRCTWCILDSVHKARAQALDYESYQNYWPTDKFCKPEWQEQVEKWILGDDGGGDF